MWAFEDVQSIWCDQNLTKQSSHSVVHQTATITRSPRKSVKLWILVYNVKTGQSSAAIGIHCSTAVARETVTMATSWQRTSLTSDSSVACHAGVALSTKHARTSSGAHSAKHALRTSWTTQSLLSCRSSWTCNIQQHRLQPTDQTIITNGQSNFTTGRIAAAHGRFNNIRHVASMSPT